jgi:hypothetical protein
MCPFQILLRIANSFFFSHRSAQEAVSKLNPLFCSNDHHIPIRPADEMYNGKVVTNQNPVKKHLSIEKSCHAQGTLTSCPLLKCTEAALRHAFRLMCQ